MHTPQPLPLSLRLAVLLALVLALAVEASSRSLYILSDKQLFPRKDGKIFFLNRLLSKEAWVKARKRIECQAKHGNWTLERTPGSNILPRTVEAQSPCWSVYNIQGACTLIYKPPPNTTIRTTQFDYSWKVYTQSKESEYYCKDELLPFSGSRVCGAMKKAGGGILVVGDSISGQFLETLKNAFFKSDSTFGRECCLGIDCSYHINHMPCTENIEDDMQLNYQRNDILSLREEAHSDEGANIYEFPWMDMVRGHAMVVLNRGAHFQPTEVVLPELNETMYWLRKNHPNVTIVFRNTVPGIMKDYFYEPPQVTMPEIETIYNYEKMQGQNDAIEQMLQEYYPEVLYLDVFTPTVLRRDSRANSLHFCIPGPVDNWILQFYNAIGIIENHAEH
jgi:hypothetical protein